MTENQRIVKNCSRYLRFNFGTQTLQLPQNLYQNTYLTIDIHPYNNQLAVSYIDRDISIFRRVSSPLFCFIFLDFFTENVCKK